MGDLASAISGGQTCPPPEGLLKQIEIQIKNHEYKAEKLKILKFKLQADPELEDAVAATINMIKGY